MLGYARVSTIQDLDAQLAALDAAGVDASRVFTDKLSGSAKTARPGLVALLDYARPGDSVVVAAIDRLGRSVAEVTRTIADLGERRITLHVLREGVDTATPTGRAIAAIMASLAELELELGRERRAASRESRSTRHLPATKPRRDAGGVDDTGDVAAGCGGLDERMNRLTRGHVDGRCAHLEPGVAQHLGRRVGIALVQVGQQDVLAKADPPGDCLTDLPGSDDNNDFTHDDLLRLLGVYVWSWCDQGRTRTRTRTWAIPRPRPLAPSIAKRRDAQVGSISPILLKSRR